MKIAMFSTSDIGHGAGVAAYRLHRSLRLLNVQSHLLVAEKLTRDPSVIPLKPHPTSPIKRFWRHAIHNMERGINLIGPQGVFSYSCFGIKANDVVRDADLLHFHNFYMSRKNLSILMLRITKPMVWTLHDFWPLTGHCFYPYECERWQTGCGKCPHLDTFPKLIVDTTALQWQLKKKIYSAAKPVIVTPSRWLESKVRSSPLFGGSSVERIAYSVDPAEFPVLDKANARRRLELAPNRRYLLWAAADLSDPRKNFHAFVKTMSKLKDSPIAQDLSILLVGKCEAINTGLEDWFETIKYGLVRDVETLATIYNAADLSIVTSLQDNLPNVVLESLSCGTPVIGFDVGGMPDMVLNDVTGYLLSPNQYKALSEKIAGALKNPEQLSVMSEQAVRFARSEFSVELQSSKYNALYERVLADHSGARQ
jgi:glycosyltransferase involved in cell wall biosynthesis